MSIQLKYIDTHGHINFSDYDRDREDVIKRTQDAGVGIITVGTDIESSKKAVELAETHENIWATVGFHPTDAKIVNILRDFLVLDDLAKNPKVVAIGECGLDYFHSKLEEIPKQREIFERHIDLANKVRKPLMLHVRNAKLLARFHLAKNAYQEVVAILKNKSKVRANFHFFAGTIEDAREIVSMGNSMSFGGVITFARDYDEIIKNVPLTNIMSETDCPFVAPMPYRGKRNEPLYVIGAVKKIAEIREELEEIVAVQLLENARNFFALPSKVEPR